ncbi:MAG: WD40/YVTN/BNR-like repeat-containing protein [Candidatus Dormibacteria bacterium]
MGFLDADHGFMVEVVNGDRADLFLTADGGVTWTPVQSELDLSGVSLRLLAPGHLLALGRQTSRGQAIYESTDGGRGWKQLTFVPAPTLCARVKSPAALGLSTTQC